MPEGSEGGWECACLLSGDTGVVPHGEVGWVIMGKGKHGGHSGAVECKAFV